MMMAMNETHAAEPARKPRTVAIIRIISRSVRRGAVLHVNPRFTRATAHFAGSFCGRRSPREPDRIHRHPRANLPLAHQLLIARRQAVENVLMLRNSIVQRFATR